MRVSPLVLVLVLAACKDGGEDEEEFPDCATGGEEFEFQDAIGLDTVSIQALRADDMMGTVAYEIYVHGEGEETTQLHISFRGMPVVGMEYQVTHELVNDQPVLTVFPESTPITFVEGTLTFLEVGTASGDPLWMDLRLEFDDGSLHGCLRLELD
jgi:hypothetical protein